LGLLGSKDRLNWGIRIVSGIEKWALSTGNEKNTVPLNQGYRLRKHVPDRSENNIRE
jgi:hypothetical protein